MEKKRISFEDIIKLEKNKDITQFRYKHSNMPIWIYARGFLISETSFEQGRIKKDSRMGKVKKMFFYIKQCTRLLFHSHMPHNKKILFITPSITRSIKLDNKNLSWQTDFYAEIYPNDTCIMQLGEYVPKPYFDVSYQYYLAERFARFFAELVPECKKNIIEINRLIKYIEIELNLCFSSQERNNFFHFLLSRDLRDIILSRYWKRLLNQNKFQIIFVDEASYGGYYLQFKEAKRRKIVCAELQHGIMCPNYPEYTYADEILKTNDYKILMPDYTFTFGESWNKYIKNGSKVITLGYTKNFLIYSQKDFNQFRNTMLFISHELFFDEIAAFISELIGLDTEIHNYISIRPHPSDREGKTILKYEKFCKENKIHLDIEKDAYKSLLQCNCVVGYESTMLYESSSFGIQTYLIKKFDRGIIAEGICDRVSSPQDLLNSISLNKKGILYDTESFFDSNWKNNYKKIINDIIYR